VNDRISKPSKLDTDGSARNMSARTPQRQQLIELLDPAVQSAGYDLEDVSVTAAGRRSLIRVVVDGDHGIDLDGVAAVARAVSELLDGGVADDSSEGSAADPAFAGPYVLEVTSPGVDRPLTEPRHWRRAVGRLVTVSVSGLPLTGRVLSADERVVVLDVDGTRREVELSALGPGRVQVEFSRPGDANPDDGEDVDEDDFGEDLADDSDEDDSPAARISVQDEEA
jgi:ribosome maturation factor RimP